MQNYVLGLISVGASLSVSQGALAQLRQVAAPAEDVLLGRISLPAPAAGAITSRCAWFPIELEPQPAGGFAWEVECAVEPDPGMSVVLLGENALDWRWQLADPLRVSRPLEHWALRPEALYRAGVEAGLGAQRLELALARAGRLRMRVESDFAGKGWLALRDNERFALVAHANRWSTLADGETAILAFLSEDGVLPTSAATLDKIYWWSDDHLAGDKQALYDDGAHGDGLALDGLFGAYLPAELLGEVSLHVAAKARADAGASFVRTLHQRLQLLAPELALRGDVQGVEPIGERGCIEIGVLGRAPKARVLLAAEFWGEGVDGEPQAVCWLARIAELEPSASQQALQLLIDPRWLALTRARPPYELRNLRLQDPDTSVVFAQEARVALADLVLPAYSGPLPATPTWSMLAGSAGAPSLAPIVPRSTTRALLLSHGHCSAGNVWPAADFQLPKRNFLDPNADRTNDEFAQEMLLQTSDLGSFGVVGHSQGGLAALQLYTYYTSGLDHALGPRRIQSVASPYQGTPLAAFSAGCGTDNDLTPAEAAAWLATIPAWARAEVYFWTVGDAGSACNFFTDFLLSDPEDGVVERFRGDLPGGNSMGHASGWCHTTGMSYPACYLDHTRNQEMDQQAAR